MPEQRLNHFGGGIEHVLAVIQRQQGRAMEQPRHEPGLQGRRITGSLLPKTERRRYGRQDERTVRQLGMRRVENDEELQNLIREAHEDFVRNNQPDIPVTIDADPRVPWNDVMTVVNLCKRNQIDKIEFAMGAPPPPNK